MVKQVIRVVSAAILNSAGDYLITQRNPDAVLPLRWEFPGGRVAAEGETDQQALVRVIRYRLGVEVTVEESLSSIVREYERYTIHLQLYRCHLQAENVEALRVNDVQWCTMDEFEKYDFTPADQDSMDKLLNEPVNG